MIPVINTETLVYALHNMTLSSKLAMLERISTWLKTTGGGRGRSGVLPFLLQMAPRAPEMALQQQFEQGMGQMEMSGQKTLQR